MSYSRWAFIGFLAVLVAGCSSSPRVTTDYQAGYDFAALKSFTISEVKQDT